MNPSLTRREWLGGAAVCAVSVMARGARAADAQDASGLDFPLLDLHVHLDNSSIDQVLPLAAERGVKFGIVEHAGTEENNYPNVLSSDAELIAYVEMLEGKPVYKGVQAEWTDWSKCFSKEALARLDYVLTDTMTFPRPNGERMKLWEDGIDLGDLNTFMDRFTDWHVQIIEEQPINLLANVSWLPKPFSEDYEGNWTDARITRVLDAALKKGIAIEISSSFLLPKTRFLHAAKEAGLKFTFGSNGRYPNMGKLEYSIAMARELGLKREDMFVPGKG